MNNDLLGVAGDDVRTTEPEFQALTHPPTEGEPSLPVEIDPQVPDTHSSELRRSTRDRKPPEFFTARMKGKYHQ